MHMLSQERLQLGVNIDHSATLRQARYRDETTTCGGIIEPDPVRIAHLAELAGADGITVHLREDRRHIQEQDVRRLRESISTRMNLEMACTSDMIAFAADIKPETVCLVPESRDEVTTEGGLDLKANKKKIVETVEKLTDLSIKISLFIDPNRQQIEIARELDVHMIELHTGAFANSFHSADRDREWERLATSARFAHEQGILVNAGHGINYVNIYDILRLPYLHELNIGHSILSRALSTGIQEAVREMKAKMANYHYR